MTRLAHAVQIGWYSSSPGGRPSRRGQRTRVSRFGSKANTAPPCRPRTRTMDTPGHVAEPGGPGRHPRNRGRGREPDTESGGYPVRRNLVPLPSGWHGPCGSWPTERPPPRPLAPESHMPPPDGPAVLVVEDDGAAVPGFVARVLSAT